MLTVVETVQKQVTTSIVPIHVIFPMLLLKLKLAKIIRICLVSKTLIFVVISIHGMMHQEIMESAQLEPKYLIDTLMLSIYI